MDDRIYCRMNDYGNELWLYDRANPLTKVKVVLPRAAQQIQNPSDREAVLAEVVLGINEVLALDKSQPALAIPVAGAAT